MVRRGEVLDKRPIAKVTKAPTFTVNGGLTDRGGAHQTTTGVRRNALEDVTNPVVGTITSAGVNKDLSAEGFEPTSDSATHRDEAGRPPAPPSRPPLFDRRDGLLRGVPVEDVLVTGGNGFECGHRHLGADLGQDANRLQPGLPSLSFSTESPPAPRTPPAS